MLRLFLGRLFFDKIIHREGKEENSKHRSMLLTELFTQITIKQYNNQAEQSNNIHWGTWR
jgi:hypothetical protein